MTYVPTPDTRHSIVISKTGDYRGGTATWSNRYHFEGDLPSDEAAWSAFAAAIIASEKTCFTPSLHITEAKGYDCSSATSKNLHGDAVYVESFSIAGTFAKAAGDTPTPGDVAALVRWGTPARSVRNHPVYLMNYFHNAWLEGGTADTLAADQKLLLEAFADDWITGFTCDGTPRERCGPHGAVATSRYVHPYVTHRDFPR